LGYDLICLGNLTIDDVVLPDQTQQLGCFGGDAIYSAFGAACWSDKVGFVAPVGTDFPPEHLIHLQETGWDTRGLPKRSIPSIRNWVIYQDNNNRKWILESDPDDFFELSPTLNDIPCDYLDSKAFMILAMDLAAQEILSPLLRKNGLVAVDPQEDYVNGNIDRILSMLKNVDIFLPSQEEVFRLLGHHDYNKACEQFGKYGARIVVIKMGSEGSLIYDTSTQEFLRIPVYETKVVDTTGAGDAYCGGFMAMLVKTGDLKKAGLAGAVSASFAIEGIGLTHMLDIDHSEALARFKKLEKLVKQNEMQE
jgi:sugar/nucleoside kinase (ribokinase family)